MGNGREWGSSRQTRLWRECSSIPVTVAYVISMRANYMRPTRAIGMIAAPFLPAPSALSNVSNEVVLMSTAAPTNSFLLESAKKQLGFKPTALVSLNDVDNIAPHQRYLSEQLVLMNSLPPFNPFNPSSCH